MLDEEPENTRALEALEGLYRRRSDGDPEQTERLAKILEQRGASEMDSERRQALYAEAARIHERRGDMTAAIAGWQSVREGEEGSAEALDELAGCWSSRGTTRSWLRCWRNGRGSATRAMSGRPCSSGSASCAGARWTTPRGRPRPSRRCWTSRRATGGRWTRWPRWSDERGDFAALEEVLLRRLSVAEGSERVDTLLALARNAEERLDDNDRAASYLHQILETDPVNREAYQALARLLEQGERWYDLIELYERRATAEAGRIPQAEIDCRLAIAELWGRRLNDDDSARDAIEKILALRPGHGPALLALAGVYERAEAWAEAAETLEKAAAASETAHDRAEVHFRRSRVLEARGASDDEVEASLRAALEAEAGHIEALKASEVRARKQGDSARLVQLLEARGAERAGGRAQAAVVGDRDLVPGAAGLAGPGGRPP